MKVLKHVVMENIPQFVSENSRNLGQKFSAVLSTLPSTCLEERFGGRILIFCSVFERTFFGRVVKTAFCVSRVIFLV